jgi:hypothetical protein
VLRARVLRGLLRPKLYLGCDARLLLLSVGLVLGGIFAWPLFIVAVLVYAVSRVLGAISPYLIDDVVTYMRWRAIAWDGQFADEGNVAKPCRRMQRTPRKVRY